MISQKYIFCADRFENVNMNELLCEKNNYFQQSIVNISLCKIFSSIPFNTFRFYKYCTIVLPVNPSGHEQLNIAIPSMQVAPLWQGFDQHSFQFVWQWTPV